jgi:SAM-dependent methyltransferase
MSRHPASIGDGYFDALYARDIDPWAFATSDYERDKYMATLAMLPERPFANALEVGCSIGIFTARLAPRCGRLLALDVAEAALARARENCAALNVTFLRARVPEQWPQGMFDLIVLSEMLYYLDASDLMRVARQASGALAKDGIVLLVHYLGETDYPLTGDAAAEAFIAASGLRPTQQVRAEQYRIDRLARA